MSDGSWILLRGLTREARHWGDFPARLAAALPGARIVALDLPGSGTLNGTTSPWRIEEIAQHCRAELARQGIAPPYRLLALSLGAMVALAWATVAPAEIASGVLINASTRRYSPFHWRLRPAAYATVTKLLLLGAATHDGDELILRLTSAQPETTRRVLADWAAYREERPVSRHNALRQLFAAAAYRAPPTPPAVPLLLLAGAGDRLVDARCSAALAHAWQCDLALHPWAGHDLPLDDADWVVARVHAWLEAASPPATAKPTLTSSTDLNRAATAP